MSTSAPPKTPSGVSADVMDGRRTILARDENMRHVRHADILDRWPVVGERWASDVEETRIGSVDRTPGTASFGR